MIMYNTFFCLFYWPLVHWLILIPNNNTNPNPNNNNNTNPNPNHNTKTNSNPDPNPPLPTVVSTVFWERSANYSLFTIVYCV